MIQGVLFDKDGTLFDFGATWDVWAGGVIRKLAGADDLLRARMAAAIDYDLAAQKFRPGSLVIAGTNREAAEALASVMPQGDVDEIELQLTAAAATAPLVEAVPLAPLLAELSARGLAMGVVTNDSEIGAQAHLKTTGVLAMFDFVAGFDSGYGAKPDPDPLLGAAQHVGLAPEAMVMVGDSQHDLLAGRAAGMATVGVLTGMATQPELAPLADVVLPDVGHLPAWIDQKNSLS